VVATDENDCEVEAVNFDEVASINPVSIGKSLIRFNPNPVRDILHVQLPEKMNATSIIIYNYLGEVTFREDRSPNPRQNELKFDCSAYPEGIYIVEIITNDQNLRSKFIKQ
jgi:hypothetical protein